MALIRCPHCGANISDRAKQCPKCGTAFDAQSQVNHYKQESVYEQKKKSNFSKPLLIGILGVIVLFVLIMLYNNNYKNNVKTSIAMTEEASMMHNWMANQHHHLVGDFVDESGHHPVAIDFDSNNGNITNVIFTNVTLGGKIKMTCTDSSKTHLMLRGKDGSNDFTIELNQKSDGKFEGEAIDGKKSLQVYLTSQCSHGD